MTRTVLLLYFTVLGLWPVSGGTAFDLEARKDQLPWIWQSPQPQVVPEIENSAAMSEVDRFLMAKLRATALTPAAPADDLTWLRRVSFVTIGLPPERALMQAFLADQSPSRRERVVDTFLASPHFGERWARHWMDLVRYAESRGHEEDFPIANAWRYRDYLVRAFNADVPYNRFVTEHLAGDIVPPRLDPATGANESVLATGWAFLGEENHSPVDIRLDECERVDNKIDVLTKTLLGLTVACARCHDHKFDAISQRDYYALAGFVISSPYRQVRFETMHAHAQVAERLETLRASEGRRLTAAFAASARAGMETLPAHLTEARRQLLDGGQPAAAGLDAWRVRSWVDQLANAAKNPDHPLHQVGRVAVAAPAEASALMAGLESGSGSGHPTLPADAVVIADFTRSGRTPWKPDGPTFGTRPLTAGEIVIGTPEQPMARVLTTGAAVRDPFWNRLALRPGNEMDAGALGAAARAGKSVRTPIISMPTGRLHYLIRGRATVYAGVDSHLMIAGPLHGALVKKFDTGNRANWVTHDLSPYAGHRVHLEFAPQDDSGLEVMMAIDSAVAPEENPEPQWRPESSVNSWDGLANTLQADALKALVLLSSGSTDLPPRLAVLADWMVRHPELTGASTQAIAEAAAAYFRARSELARDVQWESATAVAWADGTGVDDAILLRGKPTTPGSVVPRGLPEAFGRPRITPEDSSGRDALAWQLTAPDNPLLSRVWVNRVWHHVFGRGLVATVDNFGLLGERPTHPELLDHLAWRFGHVDGWSLKRLVRQLLLTDAFARGNRPADARAEEVDPSNRLLHRMPVRRLEGEAIRDALLAVSGRLDRTQGGPPVPLYLDEFTIGRGRPQTAGPLDGAGRRSLYVALRRNFLPSFLVAFDLPTPFSTVGRRHVTNVPAQSLALMNDPMVREQATVWANRMLCECSTPDSKDRVQWLFESAYGRPPAAAESAATLETLAELRELHRDDGEAAVWAELCHALLGTNNFIHLQ